MSVLKETALNSKIDPPLKNGLVLRYRFIESSNKLIPYPPLEALELSKENSSKIKKIMRIVETKSGIRKTSSFLIFLILAFLSSIGFGIGMYMVILGKQLFGGIALIVTPLLSFFLVFGWLTIRGTQIERFDTWWMKKSKQRYNKSKREDNFLSITCGSDLIKVLRKMGFRVSYSFSLGNYA